MDLLSTRIQYNQFNTIIKCSTFVQVDYIQIKTEFKNPLIFYQYQISIHPIIQQAYYILLTSEQYKHQYLTSLWYYINLGSIQPNIFYSLCLHQLNLMKTLKIRSRPGENTYKKIIAYQRSRTDSIFGNFLHIWREDTK